MIPSKNQILKNFLSCVNWEEKYTYIIDLGQLLPKFPKKFQINQNLISGCQSYTWIALEKNKTHKGTHVIKFYGNSESSIVKGIIVIIFSLYKNLDLESIQHIKAKSFLDQFKFNQNLTVTRSQGIYLILNNIRSQAAKLADSK